MNYYQQPFFYGMQPNQFLTGQQPYLGANPYQQVPYQQVPFQQQPFAQPNLQVPFQQPMPDLLQVPPFPPTQQFTEQSYIENILRLNLGKVATVYMNFEGSTWGSKIFKGYLLAAGKDHIILKDLQTETRYILLMVYLSYVTSEEELDYDYPFRNKEKKE